MAEINFNQLVWHSSRRGMLELDLILLPFLQQSFGTLPLHLQQLYQQLLERNDSELYSWLVAGRAAPLHLQPIIALIKQGAQRRTQEA